MYRIPYENEQITKTIAAPYAPVDFTEEEKAQFRENIGAGSGSGGGRNLLDNGWFTVNQRGRSSYSSGYTLDRWFIGGGTFTVTKLSGYGINISKPANSSMLYMQTFESARFEAGKTYTLSINVDGVVYSKSFVYDGGSAQSYHNYVDFNGGGFRCRILQSGLNADLLEFRINEATTSALNVNIYSVMIEPGSTFTLENDAPPDYTTELLKCMRYFRRFGKAGSNTILGSGFFDSSTQFRGGVVFPTPMRTPPQIVASGANGMFITAANSKASTGVSSLYVTEESAMILLTVSGATSGIAGIFGLYSGYYLDFSADL